MFIAFRFFFLPPGTQVSIYFSLGRFFFFNDVTTLETGTGLSIHWVLWYRR